MLAGNSVQMPAPNSLPAETTAPPGPEANNHFNCQASPCLPQYVVLLDSVLTRQSMMVKDNTFHRTAWDQWLSKPITNLVSPQLKHGLHAYDNLNSKLPARRFLPHAVYHEAISRSSRGSCCFCARFPLPSRYPWHWRR